MPTGGGGDAKEAGDDVEYIGKRVSGGELNGSIESSNQCVFGRD